MKEGVKMPRTPIDCEPRKTGSKARAIVHYKLNAEHWDYREETGNDYGRDCVIELSENDCWNNHKIEGQIKGTRSPEILKREKCFSFPLEVKTINYALNAPGAFVLFYVDVENELVYYLPIQDYCLYTGVKTLAFQAKPLGQPHISRFRKKKCRDTKLEVRKWKTIENQPIARMISNTILYG